MVSAMMTFRPFDGAALYRAAFVSRPNRFVLDCRSDELGPIRAFLPNPGRLRELLLPGVTVYVTDHGAREERATRYTAVAVERDGVPIFLHTHVTNGVARALLENAKIPTLENARIVRAEAPVGHSRFDFLLEDDRGPIYLEVKSCTLFGGRVAMFPDAVTERGRRHLIELAAMARHGTRTAVVFIVHSPRMRWFMPDYHTDLAFSRTLLEVCHDVPILPVTVEWRADLSLGSRTRLLEIPWDYIEREAQDRGSYLLLLRLPRKTEIEAGALGRVVFRPGYYVYAGSAMANLSARIERHKRLRKRPHWHIDYLRPHADELEALPIRASERLESKLADALAALFELGPKGFGCTDKDAPTHLFFSKTNPLDLRAFHDLLEAFRMGFTGDS